jgi:hypothetical protein
MFGYPLLKPYDWFWRLDSDSFILGPLTHDPFRRMAEGRYVYGYMGLGREDEYLTTGLWNATRDYMLSTGLKRPPPLLQQHLEPEVLESEVHTPPCARASAPWPAQSPKP